MAEQPIDLEAVRRVDTKIDQVLAAYPELQAVNPERLQALEERLQEEYTMTEGLMGKARGRPKTKEYVTMLARVPAELADLVKRYAAQHGQIPVSELIREGLEWRIGDGDPRGTGLYLDEPVGIREREHTSNTEIALSVPGADVLQEVRTLLAQQWEQIQALAQALERQRVPASDGVYSSNTTTPATAVTISYQEAQHPQPVPLAAEQVPGSATPPAVPFYDLAKHHLGTLCRNKHEWGSTGQSLRNADNQCLQCKAQEKREKRKAKREGQSV